MPAPSFISQLLMWLWGNAVSVHPEPTEQGWSLVKWLVLHLQLTVPFNEKRELGAGPDVRGISERAAQVE